MGVNLLTLISDKLCLIILVSCVSYTNCTLVVWMILPLITHDLLTKCFQYISYKQPHVRWKTPFIVYESVIIDAVIVMCIWRPGLVVSTWYLLITANLRVNRSMNKYTNFFERLLMLLNQLSYGRLVTLLVTVLLGLLIWTPESMKAVVDLAKH